MSSALWWVTNGRAVAPPGIGCSIGVSTSTKPSSVSLRRIDAMISDRRRKAVRASSETQRST